MHAPGDPHSRVVRSHRVLAGLVLVVAALLAYANGWHAPFVYDDILAIPQNPSIRRLWSLGEVLLPKVGGGVTVSGRPVLNLSLALNYAVSGTAPWSYHVANTLLHAGSALLLFGIVRRTIRRLPLGGAAGPAVRNADWLALFVAAFWTLHPLQTQAVTYTVQRAESLMGFFYLLTLYAFIRGSACAQSDRPGPAASRWRWTSVLACALGMGTKEVMVTAPLLVLLYDRTFVTGSIAAAWHRRWRYYLALGATWLVLGALVLSTGGNRGGTVGPGVGLPLWAYPLTQFEAVARYLGLSVWPAPLIFDYGTFWVRDLADVLPAAALVVPLVAATLLALWRWPVAGFLGAWFCGILAPTSLAPGTIQMIVEHRMYLPLAAVAAGLGWVLSRLGGRRALLAGAGAVAALGVLTVRRNHDYRSTMALWRDTAAKRPLNPRAHEGLAEALAEAGRLDEAIRVRAESVRLLPDESHYHYNLGLNLAQAGRHEDAVRHYRLALNLYPGEARTHNNLAIALRQLGRPEEALRHYAEAERLAPGEALYPFNHGIALMRLGRTEEAIARFRAALRLRPDYPDAHFNLAGALAASGRLDEALAHYVEALRLAPGDVEIRTTYGGALLLARRPAEALREFRSVLAAKPQAAEARYGEGNALAALGRRAEAIAAYEALLRDQPSHADAHFKLANTLLDVNRVAEGADHYRAALRLRPDDAEAHHNLGTAYARLEQWAEAQREFETALRLKPDYADARRHLEQLRSILAR